MTITITSVITVLAVIALTAWAVVKGEKGKREKKNWAQIESKRIGVPVELILKHEKDTSIGLNGLIKFLETNNKNPQMIEHLRILSRAKAEQEEKQAKIVEERIDNQVQQAESNHELLGLFGMFAIFFVGIAVILFALTLVIPSLVFSWVFVGIATILFMVILILRSWFK